MLLVGSKFIAGQVLIYSILIIFYLQTPALSEEIGVIQYITDKNSDVSAILTADPSPGTIPITNTEFIQFKLDDKIGNVSLSSSGQNAKVKKRLSSISEGRHSASLTTLTPEKIIKDNKQLLFYYDKTPPMLERVFPETNEILKQNVSFLVEFSDEDSGIPTLLEEMDVSATINGSKAAIRITDKNYKRFFVIDLLEGIGAEGTSYSLYLSLKDRAGNEATLSDTLHTQSDYIKTHYRTKTCSGGRQYSIAHKLDVNFPILSRYAAGALSSEDNSYVFKVKIGGNEDFDDSILHSITVASNHPAVTVTQLSSQNNEVGFRVTQQSPVSFVDGLAFLTVEFPSKLSLRYSWECRSRGGPKPVFDSATVSSDRDSLQIPILLYKSETVEFKHEVITENNNTFFYYNAWSTPSSRVLDTSASVLTFQDSHYFFEQTDWKFSAKAPVEKEGYYTFQITLVSDTGVWGDTNATIRTEEDEVFVNLGSPTISSFKYNKQKSQLEASLSDIGTPLGDLKITLSVDGFGERDFTLQKQSDGGIFLRSPLSLPTSIVNAFLTVTDLAENTVTGSCKIFGSPPDQTNPKDPKKVRYYVKSPTETPPDRTILNVVGERRSVTRLSSRPDGLSNIRRCKREKLFSRSDYYYRNYSDDWYRGITKFYPYDMVRARGDLGADIIDTQFTRYEIPLWRYSGYLIRPSSYKTYTFNICENDVADVSPPEVKNIVFDSNTGKLTAKISDHGRLVSGIKTELNCVRTVPKAYYQRKPTVFDSEFIANPRPVRYTTISAGSSGTSSTPNYIFKQAALESLSIQRVDRYLRPKTKFQQNSKSLSESEKEWISSVISKYRDYLQKEQELKNTSILSKQTPRTITREHGLVGTFQATILIPPLDVGEIFDVTIYATDLSGNRGSGILSLTIPRNPPQVHLELLKSDGSTYFSSFNGTKTTAQFFASAVDDSALDFNKINFEIDDQLYSPLSTLGEGDGSEWENASTEWFNASVDVSLLEQGLGRRWKNEFFDAHYGMNLGEGDHRAVFSATDILGLSSEATLDFSIEYYPVITDFSSKSKAIQDRGGPAFTATILDRGKDLYLSGIIFKIDGFVIERDKLFFDSPSGYFSVAGPLELGNGFHVAELTATDSHGHQDQKNLRFVVSDTVTATLLDEDKDLRLNGINLWELQNQNNDGLANPGEFIRLFPTLLSSARFPYQNCTASLSAQDTRLIVENTNVPIRLKAGGTTTLQRGFDLQIGEDILDSTTSDPYETHFDLQIDCIEDKWDIPFTLPIYRPDFFTNPVSVSTSTPPPFVPPSVNVNAPNAGDFFQCNPIPISGTYSTGSSTLQSIEVFFSNSSGNCTIAPADGNTFTGECTTNMIFNSGSEVLEVRIITDQGTTATDTVVVVTGSCS